MMNKFNAFIVSFFILTFSLAATELHEDSISESPESNVGVIQMKNPAVIGFDEIAIKLLPDKFCYNKSIDLSVIENEIKNIFTNAGININSTSIGTPEFIVRITGNEFQSAVSATHVQSSLLRKVYLRNPRAVFKAEVWRVDVPIRFSSPDAVTDAILAEVTKQAQAFAEQWKMSNSNHTRIDKNESETESKSISMKQKEVSEEINNQYIASKNSKIFHKADCTSASRISEKNLIGFATKEQATDTGRRPCKICKP